MHDPLDFDARVVQLLGEGVHSLQQVLTGLWVDIGPPRRDLNCAHGQKVRGRWWEPISSQD